MEIFLSAEAWIALLTLTFLEIVLGVDNIIFISIVSNKLPKVQQGIGRNVGLIMGLAMRIILLLCITWIIGFTKPLFTVFSFSVSGHDIILFAGGLFLIGKSTSEMHHKMEGEELGPEFKFTPSLPRVIVQIILLDIVFSFDSILTAVGLTDIKIIMIIAMIIAMTVMMLFAKKISSFINNYPTLEILALGFLILIGFMLILESVKIHVPKGYIYFAVFFSLAIEVINIKLRRNLKKVKLDKKAPVD